jgi:hypothetical protein
VKKVFSILVVLISMLAIGGAAAVMAGGFSGSKSEPISFQTALEEPIYVTMETWEREHPSRDVNDSLANQLWPGEKVRIYYFLQNQSPVPQRVLLRPELSQEDGLVLPATVSFMDDLAGTEESTLQPGRETLAEWDSEKTTLGISLGANQSVRVGLLMQVSYDAPANSGPWNVSVIAERINPPRGCDPFGCG